MYGSLPPMPQPVLARPVHASFTALDELHPIYLRAMSTRAAVLWLVLSLLMIPLTLELIDLLLLKFNGVELRNEVSPEVFHWLLPLGKTISAGVTVLFIAAFIFQNRLSPAAVGLSTRRVPLQIAAAGLGLIGCFLAMLLTLPVVIVYQFFPRWQEDLLQRQEFLNLIPVDDLYTVAGLMLGVALHEEMLFRALLLPLLRRVTGAWWSAVLISCGIFGVLHFSQGVLGILQITLVGSVLALTFILSRSLPAVVAAHFFFNFFQILLFRLARDLGAFEAVRPPD